MKFDVKRRWSEPLRLSHHKCIFPGCGRTATRRIYTEREAGYWVPGYPFGESGHMETRGYTSSATWCEDHGPKIEEN